MLSASEPSRVHASQRILLPAWWLVTAAIIAAGGAAAMGKVVHHDVAYWIDAAGRLLDGAVLYRDMIDVNPPTNYFVNLFPAALAHAAGFDPVLAFHAFVLVLALLSAAMSMTILRRVLEDTLAARLMVLPLAIVFLALPHNDFGQREHILGMVLLPYLFLTAAGSADRLPVTLRLAAGAMAGIAIAYKPYFILYPAVAEGLRIFHARRLFPIRSDTIAAAIVVASVVLATLLAFPAYLDFIIPLGRAIYHGFEAPPLAVLLRPEFLVAALTIGVNVVLMRPLPADSPVRRCAAVLVGSAAAALLIYVMQMKGWRYQALPALMLSWTALGLLLVSRAASGLRDGMASFAALGGGLALAALFAAFQLHVAAGRDGQIRAYIAPLVELVQRESGGAPVLFLSTHLPPAFPVVNYAGLSWPYRYHHLLPLPGLYDSYRPEAGPSFRAPQEMGPVESGFFAAVVEDALRFPPRLILVDGRRQISPIDELEFDLLAYFRQDPRFDALFGNYRPAGRISDHDVYIRR